MRNTNPLLSQVVAQLRSGAPQIAEDLRSYVRLDRAAGDAFAQVWFRTRGCTWAPAGTCTMCNYGCGPEESVEAMIEAVGEALRTIRGPVDELFVSPSGSMLDPAEVPPVARLGIYRRMASFPCSKVCIETRPETVNPATVAELATALAGKVVAVELGLESSSSWIQRFCINKATESAEFPRAAALLKKHGMRVYSNVCLGTPFLSAEEAIQDASRSIKWALGHGVDLAVVFPLHVKPFTLLAWLHERGSYHPPSLWALIEVLARLDPVMLPRVTISWYRDDYGPGVDLIRSPTTCARCQARVLELLDRFRENPGRLTLEDLVREECECKAAWREEVAAVPEEALAERVLRHYDDLADEFGLSVWWAEHREAVRADVLESAPWGER